MASNRTLQVSIVLILMCVTVDSCQRYHSPCDSGQCCQLVFNFRFLSYSFCRSKDKNDDKCAQNDYCLLDSDCGSSFTCDGASRIKWGRCSGTLNPCNKKRSLIQNLQ